MLFLSLTLPHVDILVNFPFFLLSSSVLCLNYACALDLSVGDIPGFAAEPGLSEENVLHPFLMSRL